MLLFLYTCMFMCYKRILQSYYRMNFWTVLPVPTATMHFQIIWSRSNIAGIVNCTRGHKRHSIHYARPCWWKRPHFYRPFISAIPDVLAEGPPLFRNLRIFLSNAWAEIDRQRGAKLEYCAAPCVLLHMHNTAMHYARTILKHDERAARVSGLFIQLGETPEAAQAC